MSDATPDTVVVVPCHNEAARLRTDLVHRYVGRAPHALLLFVDDGSTDETHARLTELAASESRVQVLRLPANRGKAEAVRSGVLLALEWDPTFVAYWDADFSTPLDDIDVFRTILRTRPGIDGVIGSRVRRLGSRVERHALRHYLGRIYATCASLVLGLPVYDTQCGAKMFRATQCVRDAFSQPFIANWAFDVELLARLRAPRSAGAATRKPVPFIVEHALEEWRDVPGSKLRVGGMARALGDLVRIWLHYRPGRATRG